MKRIQFYKPGSVFIEYQTRSEGPSPVWVCWKPGTSQGFTDVKALLKFAGWPKSTPTGVALREWLNTLPLDVRATKAKEDAASLEKVSWGPEVHEDDAEVNSNASA
jgi:hypothetical protein